MEQRDQVEFSNGVQRQSPSIELGRSEDNPDTHSSVQRRRACAIDYICARDFAPMMVVSMQQDVSSRCRTLMRGVSTLCVVLVSVAGTGRCADSQTNSADTVEEVFADVLDELDMMLAPADGSTLPARVNASTEPVEPPVAAVEKTPVTEDVTIDNMTAPPTAHVETTETSSVGGTAKPASPPSAPSKSEHVEATPVPSVAPKFSEPRISRRTAARRPTPPPPVEIPQSVMLLRQPIERALKSHVNQRLNTTDDSCWSMMHAIVGWGADTEVLLGGKRGRRVSALRRMASNQPCGGRQLFYIDGDLIKGREGPGYQGHPAQFLAIAAQVGVEPDYQLYIQGGKYRIADLIESEKRTCFAGYEQTFKLLSLSHYLGTEDAWQNDRQQTWSIERLLSVELSQPVNGAACGGTHRLMAISYALAKRRYEGAPITGTWQVAEKYVSDYHRYTFTLQNRDGSFSSEWFRRRADRQDVDRSLQTTGHILEWLVFSLSDDAVTDRRVVRAVNYLTTSLTRHRHHDWEVGPKGHAIRALRLYHQRVFKREPFKLEPLASRTQAAASTR